MAALFREVPQHWGLRGDPILWAEMAREFEAVDCPTAPEAVRTLVEQAFAKLTGFPMSHPVYFYVERYGLGGRSAGVDTPDGVVAPDFWRETALPLLLQRHSATSRVDRGSLTPSPTSPGSGRKLKADQFAGCLVGQCLGDAIGFIVEGHRPAACQKYVSEALVPGRHTGYTRGRFAFGQYSDNSQLARELIQSFVARKRFDPPDYADRISALFTEDRIVGRGRATEEAANRLAAGLPWDEAGTPPPAAGNGSAMRAAPIGLFFSNDPAAMVRAAYNQSFITHQDRRCAAGAIAIAGATALALTDTRVDPLDVTLLLAFWVRPFDPFLAMALEQLDDWRHWPPSIAVTKIAKVGVPPSYTDGWEGISPFVTGSVLWSLYSYLRHPDDYFAAVCEAVAVGGDVDTTAAMTGAIVGARVGLQRIPEHLAKVVNDQGSWTYEDLVRLAGDCHGLVTSESPA
jgi:ADP-ribosylglycohydrolase